LKVPKKLVVRPGQNSHQVKRPNLQQTTTKNWWNSGNGNRTVNRSTHITTINNNFQKNVNWSTQRRNWGYNPWWNRPVVRPWYASSWSGQWNSGYYHNHYNYYSGYGYRPPGYAVVQSIGWGLIGWSLGTMIYDTGYYSYHNPYPVRPVYVAEGVEVNYRQPITQVAVNSAPADDSAVQEITRKSESFIAESQTAFKQRNYLVALELADKAIAASPGDGALHEYRALILFALGKFGDAAGVLNPVLASGPGWDWSTMVALYDSQETYTDQLKTLETYTEQKPDSADAHFLLGYHYMVCGHFDLATPQFDSAVRLVPADGVSKELAALTRSSANPSGEAAPAEPNDTAPAVAPVPIPLDKLTGVWTSSRESGGRITLTFKEDGKFTWSYLNEGKTNEFSGDYSINDNGLLVLDSKESQMVASVALPQDREMNFVLAGGPPADSGLAFKKD
jgi:tetratricopeptide (TPR) repeat protein